MKAIKFNTNRTYTPEGQIVVAYQVGEPQKDPDFDCEWITARFIDLSRMVSGEIQIMKLTERDVMNQYDAGHYKNVWIGPEEKAAAIAAVA